MHYRPLGKRVLIRTTEVTERTPNGLYVPKTATEGKPLTAKIIAIGEEVTNVKVNDVVLCAPQQGIKVDENLVLLSAEYLFSVVEK